MAKNRRAPDDEAWRSAKKIFPATSLSGTQTLEHAREIPLEPGGARPCLCVARIAPRGELSRDDLLNRFCGMPYRLHCLTAESASQCRIRIPDVQVRAACDVA
jgi:hypothetical protein